MTETEGLDEIQQQAVDAALSTDWISEWRYDEWRQRMPDPSHSPDEETYAAARDAWAQEGKVVQMCRHGHDSPAQRQRWAEGIEKPMEHQREAIAAMRGVLDNYPHGNGYLLTGNSGTGKTLIAGRVVHVLRSMLLPVAFVKVARFYDDTREIATSDDKKLSLDDYRTRFSTAPGLVLDDMGGERSTEFSQEQITLMLDARYELSMVAPLITLVTTNLNLNQLRNYLGERSYSRLMGLVPTVLDVRGKDQRREQAA